MWWQKLLRLPQWCYEDQRDAMRINLPKDKKCALPTALFLWPLHSKLVDFPNIKQSRSWNPQRLFYLVYPGICQCPTLCLISVSCSLLTHNVPHMIWNLSRNQSRAPCPRSGLAPQPEFGLEPRFWHPTPYCAMTCWQALLLLLAYNFAGFEES